MAEVISLTKYACDHCKQRKLRCSRETPKCASCKGGARPCVYSRQGRIPRRPRSNVLSKVAGTNGATSSQSPLQATIQESLPPPPHGNIVDQSVCSLQDAPTIHSHTHLLVHPGLHEREPKAQTSQSNPFRAASLLGEVTRNIVDMQIRSRDPELQQSAENGLSELTKSFAADNFDDDSNIHLKVQNFRRRNEVFFIPEKEEGIRMVEVFLKSLELGRPLFGPPPPELVPKLMFEPSTVNERGWLLLFNARLSIDFALEEPSNTRVTRGLQWNIWTLIEDSSIFLEPSEVKILAICMIAAHTQEVMPPNLCWNLISHACRMAQSLSLHLPHGYAPLGSEANIQRNLLFWGVFMLDKSLSFAFGRPPFLPSHLYKNVPPPDHANLAKFRPHRVGSLGSESFAAEIDEFGRLYIAQGREIAKVGGQILDALQSEENTDSFKLACLNADVQAAMESMEKATAKYAHMPGDTAGIKHIQIGINFLNFQYYHLQVYLTRSDKSRHSTCLAAARSAIRLLDTLVSHTNVFYNGIIWQRLYYPFLPYFVIFANIISNPHAADCFRDLQLLRQVVLYFLQMHSNHRSARKFEKVTDTFTRLAEGYVRHSLSRPRSDSTERQNVLPSGGLSRSGSNVPGNLGCSHEAPSYPSPADTPPPLTNASNAETPASRGPWQRPETDSISQESHSSPIALLNLFSTPSDTFATSSNPYSNAFPAEVPDIFSQNQQFDDDDFFRDFETKAQNFTLDTNFDWFQWDLCDQNSMILS